MSFSVHTEGTDRLLAKFAGLPDAARERIAATIADETETLRQTANNRIAALFRNPSRMQAALSTNVLRDGDVVTGEVIASGLPYLRIQEFGGTTRPHDIFPVNASVLAFATPGAAQFRSGSSAATDMVYTRHVSHPGSRMPERSYLRAALAMRRNAIRDALAAAVGYVVHAGGD